MHMYNSTRWDLFQRSRPSFGLGPVCPSQISSGLSLKATRPRQAVEMILHAQMERDTAEHVM